MKHLIPARLAIIAFFAVCFSSFSFALHGHFLLTLEDKSGNQVSLTREDLEALPQTEFSTTTPWTKGTHTYQGPKLSLLTDKLPQPLQSIRIFAINGYAYDITDAELKTYPYILALKQDGRNLTVRNKGPLWVLLPFDQNTGYATNQKLLNQSVWQVDKIKAL